jgi:hypothetical protein
MIYKTLVRPLLFLKDPEQAHEQTLAMLARLGFLEGALENFYSVKDSRLETRIGCLKFSNPVGLAAGFDKNGKALRIWPGFGFGFIEMGAVTALAQPGNPKPRLYRLTKDLALINRLGFNNEGAEAISTKLRDQKERGSISAEARSSRPKTPRKITCSALKSFILSVTFSPSMSARPIPPICAISRRSHIWWSCFEPFKTETRNWPRNAGAVRSRFS